MSTNKKIETKRKNTTYEIVISVIIIILILFIIFLLMRGLIDQRDYFEAPYLAKAKEYFGY